MPDKISVRVPRSLGVRGTDRLGEPCRCLVVLRTLIKVSHIDIITGDFADTYENLPLKTFAAYQYFLDFCPQATNLIMHDDDMIPSSGLHRPLHRVRTRTVRVLVIDGPCIPDQDSIKFKISSTNRLHASTENRFEIWKIPT